MQRGKSARKAYIGLPGLESGVGMLRPSPAVGVSPVGILWQGRLAPSAVDVPGVVLAEILMDQHDRSSAALAARL